MTARAFVVRPPKAVTIPSGPYIGMNDALQPQNSKPEYAGYIRNMWVRDLPHTPFLDARPGITQIATQLGNAASRLGQRWTQFTKLNGTTYTVGFCGGLMYTYDWGTDTATEIVTTAELTTAGVVLSNNTKVYCAVLNDNLVVSDGTNTPWMWDGTAHGGVTKLTNAPVFYGQPVVYYGKLFAIKNTEPNTLVWSEEADPTTGYEAGGFNNAWTLGQTSQERFYALAATDAALYVFRARAITYVLGAVTSDFSSTGTRDAVSGSVGTVSPAAVMVYDKTVYFLGSDLRIYQIRQGANAAEEIATGCRLTLGKTSPLRLVEAVIAPWTEGNAILIRVPEVAFAVHQTDLIFVASTINQECIGIWDNWRGATLDEVEDDHGATRLVHFGYQGPNNSGTYGYTYVNGPVDGTVWADHFHDGAGLIVPSVTTGFLGFDIGVEKAFTQWDLSLLVREPVMRLQWSYIASGGELHAVTESSDFSQQVPSSATGTTLLWDNNAGFGLWDTGVWGTDYPREQHLAIGLRTAGRWIQLTIGGSGTYDTDPRFILQSTSVQAHILDRRPRLT